MMVKLRAIVALVLLVALLAACGRATPEPEATPEEAATATPAATATAESTEAPSTPTLEPTSEPTPEATGSEDLMLLPVTNETMGIEVLVPEGWDEVAPGVYPRGDSAADVVSLIQQAAPGTSVEQLQGLLSQQLGVDEFPDSGDTVETEALTWDLYALEIEAPPVGTVMVDVALSESGGTTYVVLLQSLPDEYERLHEALFLPAVEGFTPVGDEAGSGEAGQTLYEDPEGRFSVPIPTNWTVQEEEGYVTLASPGEELTVDILVIEGDDAAAAIEASWATVDPDFALDVEESTELPTSAAGGVEQFLLVTYDTDPDAGEPIVQAEGRLHEGQVYVLLFTMDLEAVQRRAAQVQLIDTGFEISTLEEVDLSDAEPLAVDEAITEEIESYIAEQMERWEVPGVAVAIVQDGELLYANGFGVENLETEEPVTSETMMMIGSTTKSMTTMLMAQLVDEGLIEWDTPVVEILPGFRVADEELTQALTVENLVCACTGVPRRDFEMLFNANELSAEDTIESLADFEFFTDFGETFQYSNQMVATGGYVAALAAGGEYGNLQDAYLTLMQERILEPMGMTESTFSFDEVAASGNAATPYGRILNGELVELPLSYEETLIPVTPAGGLWSNVEEMSNYLITELNRGEAPDGTRIVSEENLAHTWEPQVEISADASYGLGWIVEDYKGLRVLSHAGNTLGFSSELAFLPEKGVGIAVLTNQQGSILNGAIRQRLLELLFEQPSETEEMLQFQFERLEEAQAELAESLQESIDADAVAPYLGTYTNEALGEMTLTFEEGALLADVGEFQSEIRANESDEGEISYLTASPPLAGLPVELTTDDEGNPIIVLGSGLTRYAFEKTE